MKVEKIKFYAPPQAVTVYSVAYNAVPSETIGDVIMENNEGLVIKPMQGAWKDSPFYISKGVIITRQELIED